MVEVVDVLRLEAAERDEDAMGRAEPEVEAKRVEERAGEGHAVLVGRGDGEAEGLRLLPRVGREMVRAGKRDFGFTLPIHCLALKS